MKIKLVMPWTRVVYKWMCKDDFGQTRKDTHGNATVQVLQKNGKIYKDYYPTRRIADVATKKEAIQTLDDYLRKKGWYLL